MLQPYVFAAVRQPRLGCLHIGFGLRQLGPIVAIVDAEQNIARPDGLIVPHRDRNDISAPLPPHTHAPRATLAENGRAAWRERVVSTCRSRGAPYTSKKNKKK